MREFSDNYSNNAQRVDLSLPTVLQETTLVGTEALAALATSEV